jgi:hypothetical protein
MKETTDIWFASFLMLKGYKVQDFEVINKGRGRYSFDIDESSWKEIKLQFSSSDIAKIKMNQLALKDMVF